MNWSDMRFVEMEITIKSVLSAVVRRQSLV
jgi:hypothetical protein